MQSSYEFINSPEWKTLRSKVLNAFGKRCMKCNKLFNSPHVDHIKPRSKYPTLGLEGNNLQILCKKCNQDKSDNNCHDYRTLEQKEVALNGFVSQSITIKTIFHERNIIEIGDIENNKIRNNFYSKKKPRRKF